MGYLALKIIMGVIILFLSGERIYCGEDEILKDATSKENPFGKGGGTLTITYESSETKYQDPNPSINPLTIGTGVVAATLAALKKTPINPVLKAATAVTSGLFITTGMVVADKIQRSPQTSSSTQVLKYQFSPNEEKNINSEETTNLGSEELVKKGIPNPIELLIEELTQGNPLERIIFHLQMFCYINSFCIYCIVVNLIIIWLSKTD